MTRDQIDAAAFDALRDVVQRFITYVDGDIDIPRTVEGYADEMRGVLDRRDAELRDQ